MEIICFSANVRQCNITFDLVLCMYKIVSNVLYLLLHFFLAGKGSG